MAKKRTVILTREEELKELETFNEKIRRDPAYGFRLLQKAGIYDEKGQLTEPYREN